MSEKDKIVKFEKTENKKRIIKLNELLDKCSEYVDKKITQDELVKWIVENITIQEYLPIETKFLLINNILYNESFNSVNDNTLQSIELETKKFWVIALAYTNISTSGYEDLMTYNSYDLIFAVMGNWLLSTIREDYNRTIDILNNAINVNNLNNILETFGSLDTQGLKECTDKIEEQLKYLKENKKQIKDLADILRFNQPSLDKQLNKNQ